MWDPRRLLDVYPEQYGFHCVGITKRGARCRNSFIKRQLLDEASTILDALPTPEEFNTNNIEHFRKLKRLAYLTLCPRWHQVPGNNCQVIAVANRWLRTILTEAATTNSQSNQTEPYPVSSHLQTPPPSPSAYSNRPMQGRRSRAPSPDSYDSTRGRRPAPPSTSLTPSQSPATPRVHQGYTTSRGRRTPPRSPSPSMSSGRASNSSRHSRSEEPMTMNINITVAGNRMGHSRSTPSVNTTTGSSSRSNNSRTSSRTDNSSSRNHVSYTSSDSTSSTRERTRRSQDVETIMERLESLEALLREAIARPPSRSSGASTIVLNRSSNGPASPAMSTISNLSMPPPPDRGSLVQAMTRSPAASPPPGPLSISTESSAQQLPTPSSSRSSSPVLLSPVRSVRSASSRESVRSNGSSSSRTNPRTVHRRPITADTTCYICYQSITSADGAVWCRRRCGQNVCNHCFEHWTANQLDHDREVTCAFCREPWEF